MMKPRDIAGNAEEDEEEKDHIGVVRTLSRIELFYVCMSI